MSLGDASATLITKFVAEWGNTTPIVFANTEQKGLPSPYETSWVRLTNNPSVAKNVEIGSTTVRLSGYFNVQIFTKPGIGQGEAEDLYEAAAVIIQNQQLVTPADRCLFTYAATPVVVGDGIRMVDQIEKGWYQIVAKVKWYLH